MGTRSQSVKKVDSLTYYMGRPLIEGERVRVHYNLHEGGFSIKSVDSRSQFKGKVVARSPIVYLTDVVTVVSQRGNERVRQEGKKNVHAAIEGTYTSQPLDMEGSRVMVYDPYKVDWFTDKEMGTKVEVASKVKCVDKHALYL